MLGSGWANRSQHTWTRSLLVVDLERFPRANTESAGQSGVDKLISRCILTGFSEGFRSLSFLLATLCSQLCPLAPRSQIFKSVLVFSTTLDTKLGVPCLCRAFSACVCLGTSRGRARRLELSFHRWGQHSSKAGEFMSPVEARGGLCC